MELQQTLDEVFVFRLKALHSILTPFMYDSLKTKLERDNAFRLNYEKWTRKQGWTIDEERHRKIAEQAAYILINRILFYKALEKKKGLPTLTKAENVTSLLENLRLCFKEALKIDYRAVFKLDPIYDEIPVTPEVAERLNLLIEEFSEYDFSKMKRDVIGTLYEKLIPNDERKALGQFYTPPQIIDLIVKLCVRNPDDKVLDPGCGSGGFLVSVYDHLLKLKGKTETNEETHQALLSQIWGIDINKFPAHLATINLAIQNLESESDLINVIVKDFFDLIKPTQSLLAPWSIITLDNEREEVEIPLFDVIVANPPYTRHEDIPKNQKEKIRNRSLKSGWEEIKLSARAGIYTYFFIHGAKFLEDGGMMGMIVSNSWLDVSYGGDLQKFFLEHFKIIAIIDADKRVFRDADVNTVIVILEKAEKKENKEDRDNNVVKFIRLKTHMEINEIIESIEEHDEYFSDERIRIYPKSQKDLYEEGFNEEKRAYVGSKWGKYIRAPEIFFKFETKAEGKLVPLKEVAHVGTYLNTGGANEFFFVKNITDSINDDNLFKEFQINKKQIDKMDLQVIKASIREEKEKKVYNFLIESQYLIPLVKSLQEVKNICISKDDLNFNLIRIDVGKGHLGKKVKSYVEWGEEKGFNTRSGRKGKKPWYRLPVQAYEAASILYGRTHGERHIVAYNPEQAISDRFYRIIPKAYDPRVLTMLLNSTIGALYKEVYGRVNLGLGALDVGIIDITQMKVLNPQAITKRDMKKLLIIYEKLSYRKIGSIFDELGAKKQEDVSLEKIKPDRKELDNLIFDLLELSKEERLEIYKAVIGLVQRRISKAEDIGVLIGSPGEPRRGWPLSPKELEEVVTLLQLSKVGKLTEAQESILGHRAGSIVRDLAYQIIKLRHEPMDVKEVAPRILDIGDDVLILAGYYELIREVMGGKTTPQKVVRNLLDVWRKRPEGLERTISSLLSGDSRFLPIESGLFGLREWSPNELFQIYVQLVSKYRTTDQKKKELFKGEAIRLLDSREVDFPDKEGLIHTLRRL